MLTICAKIVDKAGKIYSFTSLPYEIIIDNVTYYPSAGFNIIKAESNSQLSSSNISISILLSDNLPNQQIQIFTKDIINQSLDGAYVTIFYANQNIHGYVGNITLRENTAIIEVLSLGAKLNKEIGDLYSPTCRASLGDSKCMVDLSSYSKNGVVQKVISNSIFIDNTRNESNDYFTDGHLTFTSGNNIGIAIQIKECINGQIKLIFSLHKPIAVGDCYIIKPGCNKRIATCSKKFNNAINFRGEPYIKDVNNSTLNRTVT